MINKELVIHQVRKALQWQFADYSWYDMIDDCDLTEEEGEWAKEHLSYDVVVDGK